MTPFLLARTGESFVNDLVHFIPALAFAGGLVFGFSFDTTGPIVRRDTGVERDTVTPVPVEDRVAADEPMSAERSAVVTPAGETPPARDADYAATAAPAPEAAPRARPPE